MRLKWSVPRCRCSEHRPAADAATAPSAAAGPSPLVFHPSPTSDAGRMRRCCSRRPSQSHSRPNRSVALSQPSTPPGQGKADGTWRSDGGSDAASTERMPHRYALHPTLHCTTHPHHALLPHYESSSSPPTKRSSSTPHGHCRPLRAGRGVDDDDDAVVDGEESHCVSPLTRGCHPSVLIVHPPTPPNLVIAQAHLHPIIFQSSVHPPFSLLLPNHS